MRPLRALLFVLALSAPAMPARAATIGLLGGDYDPPPINNPAVFNLVACSTQAFGLPPDYFCAFYDFADIDGVPGDDGISSIDFRIFDGTSYIGVGDGTLSADPDFGAPYPVLVASPLFADGITFRLSGDTVFPCAGPSFLCGPTVNAVALFAGPDSFHPSVAGFSTAVVGVNGIASVPEPATLLLVGPAVMLAIRRRRNRGTSEPA